MQCAKTLNVMIFAGNIRNSFGVQIVTILLGFDR